MELTQVLQHLSHKVCWPLSGFLGTGADPAGSVWGPSCGWDWQGAEERLCKGNVLRCPVGKAARLVSGLAVNLGTWLLSGVT